MIDAPDTDLLDQFARNDSEEAFSEIVRRHVGLVHSVALRQTQNTQHAEEITQAVFIVLARKASSLGRKTILSSWLYHTARLTAANFHRAEFRRVRREQEVFMESPAHDEQIDSAWRDLGPLLEEAMSKLGTTDRDAIVLRFFENKTLREVGTAMGMEERAAQKRVARGLEKLRAFFTKRGLVLSAAVIAGAVSANSVKATSPALAASVKAAAFAKGSAAGASTLTLVKGALKIMAWTKAKTAAVVGIGALLVAGTATVVIETAIPARGQTLEQRLPDGSVLSLNSLKYGADAKFTHDKNDFNFTRDGGDMLAAEFKLTDASPDNAMIKPAFYRQYRCVIHGKNGIDFVEEFWPGTGNHRGFGVYSGGAFGYIVTSIFPRDSRWLWFRVEKTESGRPNFSWQTVAEFKVQNPVKPADQKWTAEETPAIHSIDGLQLALSNLTVQIRPVNTNDIWMHIVKMPTGIFQDGMQLTNWGVALGNVEDASGNWSSVLQYHRSLDPRYVWKVNLGFSPLSNFADTNLATIVLPNDSKAMETNVLGIPVTISWDRNQVGASIPTNRTDMAIRFIDVRNAEGSKGELGSGGGDQHAFRYQWFSYRLPDGTTKIGDFKPSQLTFAIVPYIRTTFYVQPKLLPEGTARATAAP